MPGHGSKHLKKIMMTNPKQLTFPWEKTFKSSFDGFFCDNKNTDLVNSLRLIEAMIFLYMGRLILEKLIYYRH
jgi:hypothetical protein